MEMLPRKGLNEKLASKQLKIQLFIYFLSDLDLHFKL